MRATVASSAVLVGILTLGIGARAQDAGAPPTSPLPVYDATNPQFAGGARDGGPCSQNRAAINAAIEAAGSDPASLLGGTVYLPPGQYCIDDEILGRQNVTLRGAGLAAFGRAPTRLVTTTDFGPNKAVIRILDRAMDSYGFSVENIGISILTTNPGIVGVDFTGVWYGAIRGVSVMGPILGPPRQVGAPGSIGFLFSDNNSPGPATACFGNLVERTTVNGIETAYRFESSGGNETLNTMTNFWASDVMTGIWASSVGSIGLTFRDGYLGATLAVPGQQAFKHTGGGLGGADIVIMNVQSENFDVPSDVPMLLGELSNVGGDIYSGGNITGLLSMTTNGPISGGSLSVTGNVSSGGDISGHNLALTPNASAVADVSARTFTPTVQASGGYECGATAACPCSAASDGIWGGTLYPPPMTQSFWASIYRGTTLHPGANTFRYYTNVGITQDMVLPDVFFTFHPTHTGGIDQVFQMSGTNTKAFPYGYWVQAYDVTIFVSETVTLSSDFIYFLEANQTKAEITPGACLYPPSIPG